MTENDPVSWFMIRPGWKVVASDDSDVGKVDEVTGDEAHDIFDGLAVSAGTFSKRVYVPAEKIGGITEGTVQLTLTAEEAERLGEFEEPAPQVQIEPGPSSFLQRLFRRRS